MPPAVASVEEMLTLHRQQATARTPQELTALARLPAARCLAQAGQIAATDAQIDRLVYELTG